MAFAFPQRLFARGLALAVAALASQAWAVSVDPQGFGQVLLYPYYTVRARAAGDVYSTLLTVTNTAADTKVLRVRFREARNGRQAASLNVFLAAYDSWTAAVLAGQTGPVVSTADQSCTDPPLPSPARSLAFTNTDFSNVNGDAEGPSLTRASEGYVEVFELGVIRDATVLQALRREFGHTQNCGAALDVPLDNVSTIGPPAGGLIGTANIIDVGAGTLYAYDATALSDFSAVPLWSPPSAATPTLADVNPKTSRVLDGAVLRQASFDVAKGASPVDAVSAALMANYVFNWYVLDPATRSDTDWIVTMPTKPFYTDARATGSATARAPFQSAFGAGGSPDFFGNLPGLDCSTGFDRTIPFDREGGSFGNVTLCFPEPPPMPIVLPWTANVLSFNRSDGGVFASANSAPYSTQFANGWAKLIPFPYESGTVHRLSSTDTPPVTFFGLPVIGFMANNFANGLLVVNGVTVLSNYSATSPHRLIRKIQ